jgi:hypothetical protein
VGGGRRRERFGFLWSLIDAPNVCVPIKFSTCSHHVPNALKKTKLVPQFPIEIVPPKNGSQEAQKLIKSIPLLLPKLGKGE